jgi:hypothetical protein
MNYLPFLVLALATWRISAMFCHEDGPGHIFKRARAEAAAVPVLRDLFGCVWCMSVWVGMFWVISSVVWYKPVMLVATGFALSAVAVIVERWMEVQERRIV